MKFGKLLNGGRDKDRSSSRGFSRGKNDHIGRVTEEKFNTKRYAHISHYRQQTFPTVLDHQSLEERGETRPKKKPTI